MIVSLAAIIAGIVAAPSDDDLARVLDWQRKRVDVVNRIMPTVVCVFDEQRLGGGSGVIFDKRGYGITNYHVVMKYMDTRQGVGGLNDGKLYPLEVLGVDVTGDVAIFKLTGKETFEFAQLGDSDSVRVGDDVIAMGNPFTLAEDYTPTVSTGLVTGVHRWQGEGETLVYTDCIQTDAAINPGNSGGPLFNEKGDVIGINGRISAEMHKYARGRTNVGLGYAISINQIKRFIPTLQAGNLGVHGTLHATTADYADEVVFNRVHQGPAHDVGIREGDRLLRFGDVDMHSANQFASILGTYPAGWPVPVTYKSGSRIFHKVLRLDPAPPPLRGEYITPEEPNRAAVEDVLQAYRSAANPSGTEPDKWTWIAKRVDTKGHTTTFTVDDTNTEFVRTEKDADGNVLRTVHVNRDDAYWTEKDRQFTLSTEQRLLYRSLRALRWEMLTRRQFWNDDNIEHAGSDALITIDKEGHIDRERRLQTVAWRPDGDVTINIGFERDNAMPSRMVVSDRLTQKRLEISFDDYREAAGVVWPHKMTVASDSLNFTETVEQLEVAR